MNTKIGVLGCGWLGLPLAVHLKDSGYTVSGTTTSKEKISILANKGIVPYTISISEQEIKGPIDSFLTAISILIINIPPGLRGKGPKESYVEKIKLLHAAIKKSNLKKIIFVSSTSVYGKAEGIINEETPPKPSTASGTQLLQSETLFRTDPTLKATIIRFGGLIGADRHPINQLSGRKNLEGGEAAINLIHQNDCIGIITALIKYDHWNTTLNAVYPNHPTKQRYYAKEARKRNLPPPEYTSRQDKNHKVIDTCNPFLINSYEFLTPIN